MNTDLIRKLTFDLDDAEKLLKELTTEAEYLNLNHQDLISVCVPKVTRWIAVAENGGREAGWMTRLIRGREMILLGMKKAYAAMIEQQKERVQAIKEQIAQEAA